MSVLKMQTFYVLMLLTPVLFTVKFCLEGSPRWKLFKDNEDLNLTCKVSPYQSVYWLFNGMKLSNKKMIDLPLDDKEPTEATFVLQLRNATKRDAGLYYCMNGQGECVEKYIVQPAESFVSFCYIYNGPYNAVLEKQLQNITFAIYHTKLAKGNLAFSVLNCRCDGLNDSCNQFRFKSLGTVELNYAFHNGLKVKATQFHAEMNSTENCHKQFHPPCFNISFQLKNDDLGSVKCKARSSRPNKFHISTIEISTAKAAQRLAGYTATEAFEEKRYNATTTSHQELKDKVPGMNELEVYIIACGSLTFMFMTAGTVVWMCRRKK